MKNKYKTYVCERCKNEYRQAWTDKEATKEFNSMFPSNIVRQDNRVILCDDCYTAWLQWFNNLSIDDKNTLEEDLRQHINEKKNKG